MHPALPIAGDFLSQHTSTIVDLLSQRSQLRYGLQLAGMLREIISETTASITEKQIETILTLTLQVHQDLSKNLSHYMGERDKHSSQVSATTDPLLRTELTAHIINIDDQMKAIRRDMQMLHAFSSHIIMICGENGLKFVRDLSVPYTDPLAQVRGA